MRSLTTTTANSILINPKKMMRLSEAVMTIHERKAQLAELSTEPERLEKISQPEHASASEQEDENAKAQESRIGFFDEKSLIIDWLCNEALILFARKRVGAKDGGFLDWRVPLLSRTHYRRGLKILPLGSEMDPAVRDLWRSDTYLAKKDFFALLNAALPLPKGAWTTGAEKKAVKALSEFLTAQPNSSKADCLKHLLGLNPSMPPTAFNSRIWAKARGAAGLEEKAPAGRKPVRA